MIPFLDNVIASAEFAGTLGALLNGSARIPTFRQSAIRNSQFLDGPFAPKISSSFAIDVILERRPGMRAAVLRAVLYALSFVYQSLVQLRLLLYRHRILRERTLGCLVISIGNLTVGGTGKTPIVEKFARATAGRWPSRCHSQSRL